MDKIGLSLRMRRLAAWLDTRCRPDSLIRRQFHGAHFGGCYVTIDPDRQAPYASANLNRAATVESHRKRGAQQALIAKRVERAERCGCSSLVSETLQMLEHPYRNLQRAGFREAYEKEVYEWNG